jgi:acyl-CoA thioester hydrolase
MEGRDGVFEWPIRVEAADIDRQGHVNNVVYLRYAQDVAVEHWKTSPSEFQAAFAWVARRHEIDYLRPAYLGDALVARTWVGVPEGARFARFVEIVRRPGGEVVARVRTDWVALDPVRWRPKRIPLDLYQSVFGQGGPEGWGPA